MRLSKKSVKIVKRDFNFERRPPFIDSTKEVIINNIVEGDKRIFFSPFHNSSDFDFWWYGENEVFFLFHSRLLTKFLNVLINIEVCALINADQIITFTSNHYFQCIAPDYG